jgi:alginate O-acetyltransferase complex protein AlgI
MMPAGDGLLISAPFWAVFALYLVVERAAEGWLPLRVRYALSTAASAFFLWFFTGIGAVYLGALLGSLVVFFLAARAALGAAEPEPRRSLARLAGLLGVVGTLWALGKIGSSLSLSYFSWLFFLGASFLLVKLWTFAKDLRDGRIEQPELPSFLAYCTFFPCFVSGPIHYYEEFRHAFQGRMPLDGASFVGFVFRALHGLVKVLVVAYALEPASLEALRDAGLSEVGLADLLGRSVVYSAVIYLNFSGYSDIAIATGGLLGIRVPENFSLPYLARNLREFWQRWHVTFTRVLTQYLFVPIARTLQTRAGVPAGARSALAYVVTFVFCGFWHGSTANFVAWGLYQGVGLAVYDVLRGRELRAARSRKRPPAPPSPLRRGLGVAATFAFVSIGWTLFVLPLGFWTR